MKPITFNRQQVSMMCRFAGIDDHALNSPTVPPAVLRHFNLKQNGKGEFVWIAQ